MRYTLCVNKSPLLPKNLKKRVHALLAEHGVHVPSKGCVIKEVSLPIFTQIVLYRLRRSAVQELNPILYERLHAYLDDDHGLGIVLAPSNLPQINILMDKEHLDYAKKYIRHEEKSAKK